ncbi:MAG: SDR family NAD(P)-dependent oxidoreductase [Ginsengibacter sp.]
MQLKNKTGVVYGAGGAIGSAVARAFAQEGARVFLTGKKKDTIEALAKDIVSKDGSAKANQVDALDEIAVNSHLERLIKKEGNRTFHLMQWEFLKQVGKEFLWCNLPPKLLRILL